MIDVVMVTTDTRSNLLRQSVSTLFLNAVNKFTLTIVHDRVDTGEPEHPQFRAVEIFPHEPVGASASRNIGAASIPKYRRQKYVMFLDDDVYMAPKWDEKLLELTHVEAGSIISGHSHPFNHAEPWRANDGTKDVLHGVPLVISTVHMMMPWELWDDVGPFDEPGGPGGSEDYALCMRAKAKGYGFAITEPQCVIHTGLTSSSGKQIVGYDEMVKQNARLIAQHGLSGVIWK